MDQVKVVDKRQPSKELGIPWQKAVPGQLYQTFNGPGNYRGIVMAVEVPAADYRRHFPAGLIFVNPDGRAFPFPTDRLIPLVGKIEWTIIGEE